jgi:hypothetical protein
LITNIDSDDETASITISISQISLSDFNGTDSLAYAMANFLHAFARVCNLTEDMSPEDEDTFLIEAEKVAAGLSQSSLSLKDLVHRAKKSF